MRSALAIMFLLMIFFQSISQSIGISNNVFTPDPSSGLEIYFNNKGILIPRVTLTSRTDGATIPNPAHSLLVYNNGLGGLPKGYYYNKGTSIMPFGVMLLPDDTLKNIWFTLGNSGTNPSNNFLGTLDNVDLVFRTNNAERLRIGSDGRIAINTYLDWFQVELKSERDWSGMRIKSDSNVQLVLQTKDAYHALHAYYQNTLPRFSHGITNNGNWWLLNRYNNVGNYEESVMFVNRNNGLVGLGVAPIFYKLEVYQNRNWGGMRVRTDSSTQIVIESGNNFWTQYAFVQGGLTRFTNNVTPDAQVWNITRFDNAGNAIDAPFNIVRNTGFVGISTDQPRGPLHVLPVVDAGPNTPDNSASFIIGPASGIHLEIDDNEIHAMNNTSGSALYLNHDAGNVYIGVPGAAQKLTIGSAGDGTMAISNGWLTYSDASKKTNIKPIKNALTKIKLINGYHYQWKNTPDTSHQIGFMAQEIKQILPEITVHSINDNGEEYYGIDYSKMSVILVEAIKELLEKIEKLSKEIEYLKIENQELRKLFEKSSTYPDNLPQK
ncbi:MAG: tail fiber domain-containing protein [Bacteroidales bacterium]|nr:tail fiber domain-containing protein [Bacteroidales bacterium]